MVKAKAGRADRKKATAATVGFEQKLWAAADALRNNMDAAEHELLREDKRWSFGARPAGNDCWRMRSGAGSAR